MVKGLFKNRVVLASNPVANTSTSDIAPVLSKDVLDI